MQVDLMGIRVEIKVLGVAALLLWSCSNEKTVTKESYKAYVADESNPCWTKVDMDTLKGKCLYRSAAYESLKNGTPIEEDGILRFSLYLYGDSWKKCVQDSAKKENSELAVRLIEDFSKNVYLTNAEGDMITCEEYLYEPSYGIRPYDVFMVGFKRPSSLGKDPKIVVDGSQLKLPKMEFEVNKSEIEQKVVLQ